MLLYHPYDGIIRIRFEGIISAHKREHPLTSILLIGCKDTKKSLNSKGFLEKSMFAALVLSNAVFVLTNAAFVLTNAVIVLTSGPNSPPFRTPLAMFYNLPSYIIKGRVRLGKT